MPWNVSSANSRVLGLDKDGSDDISVEEEEQYEAEIDGDVGDENSTSDDEDWLVCPSGSEDEDSEVEELDEPVCFIILSWVYDYQNILGSFDGAA